MYLDGTESPPDRAEPPGFCPLCRGPLVTQWSAVIQHRLRQGYFAIASPAHVCTRCQVTVRVCTLPQGKLFPTRKAARASAAKLLELRNAPPAKGRWR